MTYAPIVVFAYNRPDHLERTIKSLSACLEASESLLIIYSDGPRSAEADVLVKKVRAYIKSIDGFKEVRWFFSEKNRGLASSIIAGVSDACAEFGRAIVVEDDLVVEKHFLRYMNATLDLYADDDKVMHISGSAYPISTYGVAEQYFLRLPLCWGWATWQRAWKKFSRDPEAAMRIDVMQKAEMNFLFSHNFFEQIRANYFGKKSTWFIFWYLTLIRERGLSLFPRESLVSNIGFDGSGDNCGVEDPYKLKVNHRSAIPLQKIAVSFSKLAYVQHFIYFAKLKIFIKLKSGAKR